MIEITCNNQDRIKKIARSAIPCRSPLAARRASPLRTRACDAAARAKRVAGNVASDMSSSEYIIWRPAPRRARCERARRQTHFFVFFLSLSQARLEPHTVAQ